MLADKNDLIALDAKNGKRIEKIEHDVEKAQFVLINERGEAVVGGRDEIAAFQVSGSKFQAQNQVEFKKASFDSENLKQLGTWNLKLETKELWRVKHKPPSRGVFRVVAGIALRAAALYFRYGGLATSALNIVRGASVVRSVLSLRGSGLRSRFSSFDLTTLASNSARNYISNRIYTFGSLARAPNLINRVSGLQVINPSNIRGKIINSAVNKITPSRADVQESIFERLDPTRQMEKLSEYLLRRKRLADLRGQFMYYYTDLPKPFDKKGLIGVNVHTGKDARFILASDPDARFTTDETVGLLYSADGSRLQAFDVIGN